MNASDSVIRTSDCPFRRWSLFGGWPLKKPRQIIQGCQRLTWKKRMATVGGFAPGYDARILGAYIHRGKFVVHTSICLLKDHQKFTASKLASDSTKPLWFDATWCYYLQYEVHTSTIWGHNLRKSLEPKNLLSYETQAWSILSQSSGLSEKCSPWRFQSNLSQEFSDVVEMLSFGSPWNPRPNTGEVAQNSTQKIPNLVIYLT